MELLQGITINPGDVSLTVLVVLAMYQVVSRLLGNQRSESEGDRKIMLSLVENQTAATNRLADALEKNTESNNKVVVDAEKSRERTRQEQRDYQIAITGSLDSIAAANAQIFNKLDTDIGGITQEINRPDGVKAKIDVVIKQLTDYRAHLDSFGLEEIRPALTAIQATLSLIQSKSELPKIEITEPPAPPEKPALIEPGESTPPAIESPEATEAK